MKNKKIIIILIIVIIFCIGLGVGIALLLPKDDNESNSSEIKLKDGKKVNIVKNESSKIKYEDYDNSLVSLKIPKGWKVEVPQVDYIHYTFKVYNPENPNYMIIFGLKQEGFMKTEKARSTWAKLYPDTVFAKLSPVNPQTAEGFYKVWNDNAKLANQIDFKYEFFPYFNEFAVIDTIGKTQLGGDILRATYKNGEDLMQGLFTATVSDVGSYYMYGVDVWPLNVYHIIMMTAPDEEFINWQEIYDYCLSTITFSDTFINGFNTEEAQLAATIQANQKIYDSISDMIMDSWEKRNNSYDIISQKQSDATLGYERVYDTDTGEIYKAYNGFTDDYSGSKYKPITDDMYTQKTSGYIEK